MRLAWVVVLVAACKAKEAPPPAPAPAPPPQQTAPQAPPKPLAKLVRCAPAKLAPRAQPVVKHASAEPATDWDGLAGALGGVSGQGQGQGLGIIGTGTGTGTIGGGARIRQQPQPPTQPATMSLGEINQQGGLDKAIVRRYLKRNIQKLQFCYERQLLAKPGLEGPVQVQFFIKPDGTVASANAAGVDPEVSACIRQVVINIQFPQVPGGGGVQAQIPISFRAGAVTQDPAPPPPPKPKPKPPAHVADVKVWTPYAAGEGLAPDDIAKVAAHDLEGAIAGKLDKLDACFGDHTGSVRAMLTVAFDGGVISARVGGVGDHDVDTCIAGALIGLKVSAPPIISEVSCDLERGAPAPWRLTLDGRYEVLELKKDTPPVGEIPDVWTRVYAIVAAPDVPGDALARALHAVRWSQGTLVAVREDAGAPVFIGTAHDARTETSGDGEPIAIDLHGGKHACADHQPITEPLRDRCASDPCGTLTIAFGADTTAASIGLEAHTAAGDFDRILVGGDGCAQPPPVGSGSGSVSVSVSISGGSGGSAAGGKAPSSASPSSR